MPWSELSDDTLIFQYTSSAAPISEVLPIRVHIGSSCLTTLPRNLRVLCPFAIRATAPCATSVEES